MKFVGKTSYGLVNTGLVVFRVILLIVWYLSSSWEDYHELTVDHYGWVQTLPKTKKITKSHISQLKNDAQIVLDFDTLSSVSISITNHFFV